MVKQQHQTFVALLCAADACVVSAACFASWSIRRWAVEGYFPDGNWESWLKGPLVLFATPVVLVALNLLGLYRPRRDRSLWQEQGAVVRASAVALAALVVVLWVFGNDVIDGPAGATLGRFLGVELDAARIQLGSLGVLLPVFLGAHRAVFRLVLRSIRKRGWNLRHVAIVGVGRVGRIACQTIDRNSWTGLSVSYFVSHKDENARTECLGRPVLGGLSDLDRLLEICRVDAVYLALPSSRASVLPSLLARLERYAVDVRIVPDVNPRYLPQSMALGELDGMPILSYRECPLTGVGGMTKRVVDVVGALVALVVFAPVMVVTALLVRLSGPGPVVFKQRRVSLNGEEFEIYKFRTMRQVEDEAGSAGAWTRRDDPRVTRVGRWLRKTSIDELPQLFNVLRGEMSLVGPRPERPELIARFREDWRGYMLRQHMKAGMTGWAQVHGLRGDTSLRKRIQYDLFYLRNWSVWLDLRILWLTVFRGFVHRNAH